MATMRWGRDEITSEPTRIQAGLNGNTTFSELSGANQQDEILKNLSPFNDDISDPYKATGFDAGPHFFRVPGQLFGSGLGQSLGASAGWLYVALWENANRQRPPNNTFGTTDKKLSSETGLSPRTIRNARNRLIEKGLLHCTREDGAKFEYTLSPQNLKWTRTDERPRAKKQPRAMQSVVRQNLPKV
jgi:DNA-binding transcriptional ArsR family regulator